MNNRVLHFDHTKSSWTIDFQKILQELTIAAIGTVTPAGSQPRSSWLLKGHFKQLGQSLGLRGFQITLVEIQMAEKMECELGFMGACNLD